MFVVVLVVEGPLVVDWLLVVVDAGVVALSVWLVVVCEDPVEVPVLGAWRAA